MSAWNPVAYMLDRQEQQLLANDWFNKSRTLETVYLHIRQHILYPQHYLRWKRGEREPTQVDFEEALTSHGVAFWYA